LLLWACKFFGFFAGSDDEMNKKSNSESDDEDNAAPPSHKPVPVRRTKTTVRTKARVEKQSTSSSVQGKSKSMMKISKIPDLVARVKTNGTTNIMLLNLLVC